MEPQRVQGVVPAAVPEGARGGQLPRRIRHGPLRAGYAFNLFQAIRFDAAVETARVEPSRLAGETQTFTGFGFSGNVVGPWKTVINVNWGVALKSDIPELEGDQEFLVLILKLI